jgi:hypothetical protein
MGVIAHDPTGTHLIAIWHGSVSWAANELLQRDPSQLAQLRVRSGEHLAAILLTAFLRSAPVEFDFDGGVDLMFDLAHQDPELTTTVNLGDSAAFEIKSLAGAGFRKYEAEARGRGGATEHVLPVQTAESILRDAAPSLGAAAGALARKCQPGWSRNVFIVIHPLDHFAYELVADSILAPALPPLSGAERLGLDTVWVLWVPDHLTMWSTAEGRWTEMMFRSIDPDEGAATDLDGLAVLQAAEGAFLRRLGIDESPYLFRIAFSQEVSDDADSGPS